MCSKVCKNLPPGKRYKFGLDLESQLTHAYKVLCDLCKSLLVLVHQKLGPKFKMFIELL